MRVAVIGAGSMGALHAELLGALPEVELAVVDVDAARAVAVAQRAGGRAIGLEEAMDWAAAIVVATPPEYHAAAVEVAVSRGIHVLCEKPLTDALASSRALAEHAADAHVEVGFQRRHDAGLAALREALADRRIHLVRLTAYDPRFEARGLDAWPASEVAPIFRDSSIHDFDFVRWVTGQEVLEVTVDASRRDDPRPADPRGIETALVTMRLSGGTLAELAASWLHPGGYDIRVEALADGAALTAGLSPRTPSRHLEWAHEPADPAWAGYLERFVPAYRAELVAFLAAARGEQPPASTARDGLEAMRIAVAATRSFVERRTVPLAEVP
ncbi:MAG TPA: Gfo/Idh/MocA family oxidoreductase [Candidatus Limnocylindria bacterium]|nr:Gfo/Idh/MocA family oxidoreductase [Candidatus Limnocylindria bacterium]